MVASKKLLSKIHSSKEQFPMVASLIAVFLLNHYNYVYIPIYNFNLIAMLSFWVETHA